MCSDAEPSALVFVYPNVAKSRVLEEFLYFIIVVYRHAVNYFRPFVVFFVVPAAFVADHERAAGLQNATDLMKALRNVLPEIYRLECRDRVKISVLEW